MMIYSDFISAGVSAGKKKYFKLWDFHQQAKLFTSW